MSTKDLKVYVKYFHHNGAKLKIWNDSIKREPNFSYSFEKVYVQDSGIRSVNKQWQMVESCTYPHDISNIDSSHFNLTL